eukprot:GHVU01161474.1.p1 GENE.GHVU01161474.1~~GHVU01161474.1.p1  ORF type:complete len:155 (-),score=13.26 GHVU01161474.1:1801-2265(-)
MEWWHYLFHCLLQGLQAFESLQPGDAVVLSAANTLVGQVVIQIAILLQIRTLALVKKVAASRRRVGAGCKPDAAAPSVIQCNAYARDCEHNIGSLCHGLVSYQCLSGPPTDLKARRPPPASSIDSSGVDGVCTITATEKQSGRMQDTRRHYDIH